MRIAVIGAGNVRMARGHGWARPGCERTSGVRNPADKKGLTTALGFTPVDAGGPEAARYRKPVPVRRIHLASRMGDGPDFRFHLLRR